MHGPRREPGAVGVGQADDDGIGRADVDGHLRKRLEDVA